MTSLLARIERFPCVSFDVFDTALLRCVAEPRDLFALVEAEYLHQRRVTPYDFARQRPLAERRARERSFGLRESHEVTLEEIYAELAAPADWDLDALMQLEVECEEEVCRANPYIQEIWRQARARGKQIVFISDMYLPERVIRGLLERSGYEEPVVHVSSEHRIHKGDGRLYRHALSKSQIAPNNLLHIGDNPISDFYMAMKEGITPYYYERCGALAEQQRPVRFAHRSSAYSIYRALITHYRFAHRPQNGAADPGERFGYERVGLFAVGLRAAGLSLDDFLRAACVPAHLAPRFERYAAPPVATPEPRERALFRGSASFVTDFARFTKRYAWLEVAPELAVQPLLQAFREENGDA